MNQGNGKERGPQASIDMQPVRPSPTSPPARTATARSSPTRPPATLLPASSTDREAMLQQPVVERPAEFDNGAVRRRSRRAPSNASSPRRPAAAQPARPVTPLEPLDQRQRPPRRGTRLIDGDYDRLALDQRVPASSLGTSPRLIRPGSSGIVSRVRSRSQSSGSALGEDVLGGSPLLFACRT